MGSTCSCQVAMLHGMYMCNIAVHGNQGWPGVRSAADGSMFHEEGGWEEVRRGSEGRKGEGKRR